MPTLPTLCNDTIRKKLKSDQKRIPMTDKCTETSIDYKR